MRQKHLQVETFLETSPTYANALSKPTKQSGF